MSRLGVRKLARSADGQVPVALWALGHPVGAVPIALSLTEHRPAECRQIGVVASAAVDVIRIACARVS